MSGRLRELRKARKLSQETLGRELCISQQNLSRYELDARTIPLDILKRFSSYYNVSIGYLLGISDVKYNSTEAAYIVKVMEENSKLVEMYRGLSEGYKNIIWHLMNDLRDVEAQMEKDAIKQKKKERQKALEKRCGHKITVQE